MTGVAQPQQFILNNETFVNSAKRRLVLAALISLSLVAVACGSDSKSSSTTTAAGSAAATTTEAATSDTTAATSAPTPTDAAPTTAAAGGATAKDTALPADTQRGDGNSGVAQIISPTEGAIGYVDLSDAKANNLVLDRG